MPFVGFFDVGDSDVGMTLASLAHGAATFRTDGTLDLALLRNGSSPSGAFADARLDPTTTVRVRITPRAGPLHSGEDVARDVLAPLRAAVSTSSGTAPDHASLVNVDVNVRVESIARQADGSTWVTLSSVAPRGSVSLRGAVVDLRGLAPRDVERIDGTGRAGAKLALHDGSVVVDDATSIVTLRVR